MVIKWSYRMNTHCIILARGGSKGIPNKNIIDFCGKPLISWTIDQFSESKFIENIWVSSDSDIILDVARSHGVNVIKRPSEFSDDQSSSESAWMHAINFIRGKNQFIDTVIAPQVTSPLREVKDIDNAFRVFIDNELDSLFSASISEDLFFWTDEDSEIKSFNYDFQNRKRRQDIPKQIIENGSFYIFKTNIIEKYVNRLGGKIGYSEMDFWKVFEIDTLTDIRICSSIMKEFLLGE